MTSADEPREPREPEEDSQPQGDSQPQAAHHAPGLLRRHGWWIALSAAIALAGLAAVYIPSGGNTFLASQGAHLTAPASSASPAGPRAPNPDATKAVPAGIPTSAAVGVAAPRPLPRKLTAVLARWDAGSGGAKLAALSGQLGDTTQASGLKLYATMRLACLKFGAAVTAARSAPAIPDAAMQRWYARALTTFAKAVADCRAGLSAHPYGDEDIQIREHPKVLDRSVSELAAGAKELYLATAKIKAMRHG